MNSNLFAKLAADRRSTNMNVRQLATMYTLAQAPAPRDFGAVADELRLSRPVLTRIVDRLERDKLIQRVDDPDDRRRVKLKLTGAGRSIVALLPS